jgi:head-tail adaptor
VRYFSAVDVLNARTIVGPYNSIELDWSLPDVQRKVSASVQAISSSEDSVNQDRTVTRFRLHVRPSVRLTASSRVRWAGRTLEVEGEVEPHYRRGALDHLEAVLRLVEGG